MSSRSEHFVAKHKVEVTEPIPSGKVLPQLNFLTCKDKSNFQHLHGKIFRADYSKGPKGKTSYLPMILDPSSRKTWGQNCSF